MTGSWLFCVYIHGKSLRKSKAEWSRVGRSRCDSVLNERDIMRMTQLDNEDQDRIRRILQTDKVERGIPKYVLTAMNARYARFTFPQSPGDAFEYAKQQVSDSRLLNHSGHITVDGEDILVTEPYAEKINAETLKGLSEFAELIGADYWISANSWHYPGRTVQIIFEPKRNQTSPSETPA